MTQQQRSKGISLTDLGLDDELHTLDRSCGGLRDGSGDATGKEILDESVSVSHFIVTTGGHKEDGVVDMGRRRIFVRKRKF